MNVKLLLLLFSVSFTCFSQNTDKVALTKELISKTKKGAIVPDFVLKNNQGDTVNFYELNNTITVIDIWATWCGPCKYYAPMFDSIAEVFKGQDIKFISVSIDAKEKKWLKYLTQKQKGTNHYWVGKEKSNPITWFTSYEGLKDDEKVYGQAIPAFTIIDGNHKIIERSSPPPGPGPYLGELLMKLLKE
jgi:thiol-disulfide isomerase/thioredoxin